MLVIRAFDNITCESNTKQDFKLHYHFLMNKIFVTFIFFFLVSCGFKVVDRSKLSNFEIAEISTSGDKRVGYVIKNKLLLYSKSSERKLIKIYLDMPREKLLKRIYIRTSKLLNKNCFSEVRKFKKLKLKSSLSVHNIIGIKEINDYLDGNCKLSRTEELINIRTRQYAKRQRTWARGHMKNWNKLYYDDFPILFKKILKLSS